MKKGSIVRDAFEEALELGKSTVKSSASAGKSIVQGALDQLLGNEAGVSPAPQETQKEMREREKKASFTPLDTQKIEETYKKQDEASIETLRSRFHDMVKTEEKKVVEEKKREKQEQVEEKERQAVEHKKIEGQKQKEAPVAAPKGKERKSIFSHKKVVERSGIERKAGTGKQ
ncbi:MAG TPA: hypothetical protein VJH96_00675 [Patescibacteria group bacterium]|nr:hypothetical protein [Patescibacteria group bacterium]